MNIKRRMFWKKILFRISRFPFLSWLKPKSAIYIGDTKIVNVESWEITTLKCDPD